MKKTTILRRAFSAIEVVAVIAVIAVLSAIAVPLAVNAVSASKDRSAINKAAMIDSCLTAYKTDIRGASANWAAADNNGRYLLLYNAGYLSQQPSTLSTFQPAGYTFTLPATLDGTTQTFKNGAALTP